MKNDIIIVKSKEQKVDNKYLLKKLYLGLNVKYETWIKSIKDNINYQSCSKSKHFYTYPYLNLLNLDWLTILLKYDTIVYHVHQPNLFY